MSRITVCICGNPSSTCPRVTSRPRRCRLPVAVVSAVGVASDRAQGQVATSMASTIQNAVWASAAHHQALPTTTAASSTVSKKYWATSSASRPNLGLSDWARSSRRTMADRRVCSPSASICSCSGPSTFRVPAVTWSPGCLAMGRYSPDSADSSTLLVPRAITPSAGMLSPGLTSTRSPQRSSSSMMRWREPSASIRRALGGSRLTSLAVLSTVRCRARRSR